MKFKESFVFVFPQELLPTMSEVYGMEPKNPSDHDLELYKRFVRLVSPYPGYQSQKMIKRKNKEGKKVFFLLSFPLTNFLSFKF